MIADWIVTDEQAVHYEAANAEIVRRVVEGIGIDSGRRAGAGARVVFNLSCVHVPAVLADRYLNAYDLEADPAATVGERPPTRRERIDRAVADVATDRHPARETVRPEDLYYGAVEVNGAGMRYYGDISLVLPAPADDQLVLYRNSYDLLRPPIADRIEAGASLADQAELIAGTWAQLCDMVVAKLRDSSAPHRGRLLTTAVVSSAVLADEDYLEVPRQGPFTAVDVMQARTAVGDVAIDGMIAERATRGPAPSLEELVWRSARRRAATALALNGIDFVSVAHEGRQRP
ncbi:hypothetical protein ABZ477_11755 [Microbacterium sp. NPDC019599]|uniref:hypothetical protein n=1 Tax=Microbacterium sp. NPDC019599 TaxID=3154690 RepID=UPI0034077FE9